jgi:hypothetical protein
MQPNTITLAVDTANSGSTTNRVYTRFEELVNRTTYKGPAHTFSAADTLQFYRTLPVRSGAFLGAAKTSVKFTKAVTVQDGAGQDVIYPLIGEVSFSVPVGTPDTVTKELRQTILALLDSDTVMGPLNDSGEI